MLNDLLVTVLLIEVCAFVGLSVYQKVKEILNASK